MKSKLVFRTKNPKLALFDLKSYLVQNGWNLLREESNKIIAKSFFHGMYGEQLADAKRLLERFLIVEIDEKNLFVTLHVPVFLEWDFCDKKLKEKINSLVEKAIPGLLIS